MGLGKALHKLFYGGQQVKDGDEERCDAPHHARSQSALSWRQLKGRNQPSTPGIPTVNFDRLLSRESRKFDNTITKESLSHIMLWYLYWDIVDMPDDPDKWYEDFGDREEMVNWIRLGSELEQNPQQLPHVLRGICRELHINSMEVLRRLVRLSKPGIMVKTEIAEWGLAVIVGAEYYMQKLKRDRHLATALQPEPDPRWISGQMRIVNRIDFFLDNLFVPSSQPADTNATHLKNQAHMEWGRLGGPRLNPPLVWYERALPRTAFGSDLGTTSEPRRSSSRGRQSISISRTHSKTDDERPPIPDDGSLQNLCDASRRPTASLDDLTSLANLMNAQMANRMDTLTGTLTDRISQLQDELVKQFRSQLRLPNVPTARTEEPVHANGHRDFPDQFQPDRSSRERQILPLDDPMAQNHLFYRGRLSQAVRKREAQFRESQSPMWMPRQDEHGNFVDSGWPPPIPSKHHSREISQSSGLNVHTTDDFWRGASDISNSVVTNGKGKSRAYRNAPPDVSLSQYSPTAWSDAETGATASTCSGAVQSLPRRVKREEYQIDHLRLVKSGRIHSQLGWCHLPSQRLRVANESTARTSDVEPLPKASPNQSKPSVPRDDLQLEPFPDFDPNVHYSYPDFGNPYDTPSPSDMTHGIRNGNGVEAGSSSSWRTPRESLQQSPQPHSSDLPASSGEQKASVDNRHAEEVCPQPSGAKVLANDENMPAYSLRKATKEALEADQRYNQIEEEINGSRKQQL